MICHDFEELYHQVRTEKLKEMLLFVDAVQQCTECQHDFKSKTSMKSWHQTVRESPWPSLRLLIEKQWSLPSEILSICVFEDNVAGIRGIREEFPRVFQQFVQSLEEAEWFILKDHIESC